MIKKMRSRSQKEYPVPMDLFEFTGDDLDQWVANKCADKVDQAFVEANRKGRGVAAFICEPCFVSELLL